MEKWALILLLRMQMASMYGPQVPHQLLSEYQKESNDMIVLLQGNMTMLEFVGLHPQGYVVDKRGASLWLGRSQDGGD